MFSEIFLTILFEYLCWSEIVNSDDDKLETFKRLTIGLFHRLWTQYHLLYTVRQKNLRFFNITGLKNHQVFLPHPVFHGILIGVVFFCYEIFCKQNMLHLHRNCFNNRFLLQMWQVFHHRTNFLLKLKLMFCCQLITNQICIYKNLS